MLRVNHLSYALPDRQLLDDVSLEVAPAERVGLIGHNGEGKTTLLRIITGELRADDGRVELSPPGRRLGYLQQGFLERPHAAVRDVVGRAGLAWSALLSLETIGEAMAAPDGDVSGLLVAYSAEQERLDQAGGVSQANVVHSALTGLDLADLQPTTPVKQLSGGQRTRLELARLLLDQPDLLILDEPTNHLDIVGVLWLEQYLLQYRGAVLLVSHDRVFLDRVVTRTLALEGGTVRSSLGGYSAYQEDLARSEQVAHQTYQRQQRERERIEDQLRNEQERTRQTELTSIDFALRKKAKKGARQVKVRERRLERAMQSTDWVEKPKPVWEVRLDFSHVLPGSRQALRAEGLSFSYSGHLVLAGIDLLVQAGDRIVLTGPNGGGKSSLLRLLAGEIQPDTGVIHLGESTRRGYLEQEQLAFQPAATPLSLVRSTADLDDTAARNYLHFFLFAGEQAFTPVDHLSYGERCRLSLALILLGGANLLLLDEPLNHLDIPARERLEQALLEFPGASITVAHDRAFIRNIATRILVLDYAALREYTDAEQFEGGMTKFARRKESKSSFGDSYSR